MFYVYKPSTYAGSNMQAYWGDYIFSPAFFQATQGSLDYLSFHIIVKIP